MTDRASVLEQPLWKTFLIFLGPMMLSNVLQAMSGTLNNVFLGQMIGVHALAAATVSFPLIFFLIALVIGMGAGSSVLIGQAWGAREPDKVKSVAGSALTVTLLAGLVVSVLGGTFAHHLMALMQTPADILEEATAYARVMLIGMPAFFVFILATSMLRGVGDTVTPLWALLLAAIVGLVVTPALILGWGGLPKMGAASAAVAGVLSQLVALIWMGWRMVRKGHPMAPDRALLLHMKPDPAILRTVLKIGIPTGVQMVTVAISELVLLGLANSYGANATAAYGAVNQVLAYVQFPAMSIAITASILGAQAIGAGRIDRLAKTMRAGQLINLCLTGSGIVLVYLFSRQIIGLFITDAATADLTVRLLHIVIWSILFFGGSGVFGGIMRASGTVWAPMIMTLTAILAIELPTGIFLSRAIGITGVWWAYPAAFCSMFVMQGAFYALVWRKKTIKRLI
ncbi:MATE family efflux transporter [soil metagenome]